MGKFTKSRPPSIVPRQRAGPVGVGGQRLDGTPDNHTATISKFINFLSAESDGALEGLDPLGKWSVAGCGAVEESYFE